MSKSKTRVKRKTFEAGQAVEIRREPGNYHKDERWEPATYYKAYPEWKGWHGVTLHPDSPPRWVDSRGNEVTADTPDARAIRHMSVPSVRIRRKPSVWSGMCPAGKHGLDFEGQDCDVCRHDAGGRCGRGYRRCESARRRSTSGETPAAADVQARESPMFSLGSDVLPGLARLIEEAGLMLQAASRIVADVSSACQGRQDDDLGAALAGAVSMLATRFSTMLATITFMQAAAMPDVDVEPQIRAECDRMLTDLEHWRYQARSGQSTGAAAAPADTELTIDPTPGEESN